MIERWKGLTIKNNIMTKERKLSTSYQFNIEIVGSEKFGNYVTFKNVDGSDLPSWKEKLTKAQWAKASKYLTRKLIPFAGYTYQVKPEHNKAGAVYKIR